MLALAGGGAAAVAGVSRWAAQALAVVMAAALVWLLWRYLRWVRVPAVLTTDRFLVRRGPGRRPVAVELREVRDVRLGQTRRQRLLRCGDLVVVCASGEAVEVVGLATPTHLRRTLWRQVDRWRTAPPVLPPPPDRRLLRR